MPWSETQAILNRLGYYFDTSEEYENWRQLECDYQDEIIIKKALCDV